MVSTLLALILFISSSFSVSAVDPVGVKIRITNNARRMLKEQALAMFREQLVNQLLPEKVEKYGCTIRNFDIHQLGAIQGDLNFQDNSRIKFVIMDSTFRVSFDIKIPAMSEFKLTIAAENVNANMEVSLTRSAQGRLAIDMPVCEALAGKFLPITNGKQWPRIGSERFPQIFSFLFCRAVSWFVLPAVKGMLDTTPMTTEVSPDFGIAIDYTLTRDVQMRATGLDLSFKGLVYRPADNINPPNPGVEPAFNENTRMAYVGVSDFLFNSAATAFYSAGALVKQLNSKALKRFLRFRQFFTEPWRLRDAVGAEIKLTEAPSFSITEKEGVTINLRAKLQDSASGTRAPGKLLAVSMRCAVSMKVSTDGTHLFLPYDKVSCKIQTRNVVRDVLVKIVKTKVNKKISDFLEGFFKDGVKIPLPEGMIFTQQMITYHDGFVVLGGDLSFTAAGRQGMVNMARGPGK